LMAMPIRSSAGGFTCGRIVESMPYAAHCFVGMREAQSASEDPAALGLDPLLRRCNEPVEAGRGRLRFASSASAIGNVVLPPHLVVASRREAFGDGWPDDIRWEPGK